MSRTWHRLNEACDDMDEGPELGDIDMGAGVTTKQGIDAASSTPIKLTIGKKQLTFSPQEFVEMIQSGQLQRMVQSGQVRKLPGT